jgi:hypothetical protein
MAYFPLENHIQIPIMYIQTLGSPGVSDSFDFRWGGLSVLKGKSGRRFWRLNVWAVGLFQWRALANQKS